MPNEEIPTAPKKKWSKQKKMIASSIIIIFAIVILYFLFIIPLLHPATGPFTPPISVQKGSTAMTTTWTISHIGGGSSVLKSEVYVQLRNYSGFVINTEPLTAASGTHGFKYESKIGMSSQYIAIGDIFSISKDYTAGSTIRLVTSGGYGEYSILTV